MVTPPQCRAARAFLAWSQRDLARAADVAAVTVQKFETGRAGTTRASQHCIRQALEGAGIVLATGGGVVPQDGRLPAQLFAAQVRAARAWLGWRQGDLAAAAGLSAIGVQSIERGQTTARDETAAALRAALAAAGVALGADGGVRPQGDA